MKTAGQIAYDMTLLTEEDLFLFNEGSHFQLYDHLGSHPGEAGGVRGTHFAVWAPNAESVSLIGEFNDWHTHAHPLRPRGRSGIWEGFMPGVGDGIRYKYHIRSRYGGYAVDKADPFGFHHETPPLTASITWNLSYDWGDGRWMAERASQNSLGAPIAVYEVHLGSWMRVFEEGGRFSTYREIAPALADYAHEMGFTHVEFLPVMEHPFYGSWGYQVTGYFAPTSRYGTPQDLMFLIDYLHQRGIGVFLDWVPSHFPTDAHGLGFFDGTHLFEHGDPRRGFHPDWNSLIFNYGRHEVRSFLISSARFWLDVYHADGLRVDGVASMLYLDYSRKAGEWIPNVYGGRENLEAIAFLRRFNQEVYRAHPSIQTVAEESTAWPMVSKPTSIGGLGFGLKWDMGWMHDMLEYMSRDPIHRKFHHQNLTFRLLYAFSENFMLPLSHDEVVHGKGSLLGKMPGDEWQRFGNLRLLFAYMYGQPGKKLLFMGGEIGQRAEWNHDGSIDWYLLALPLHEGARRLVRDLNHLYRQEAALHQLDADPQGFAWIDCNDVEQSVVSLLRKSKQPGEVVAAVFNFTPVPRPGYRIGVPIPGVWRTILNTDADIYGGSGHLSENAVEADAIPWHGHPYSVNLAIPPLGALFLKPEP